MQKVNLPWLPPTPPLSMLKRPQVQGFVVRIERTSASTQLRFQLMGNAACVQIALQCSPAPFRCSSAQFVIG